MHARGMEHGLAQHAQAPFSVCLPVPLVIWDIKQRRACKHYAESVYMHWPQTEGYRIEEMLTVGNTTRSTGRSNCNNFHVNVKAVIGLLRAAINIAYMDGSTALLATLPWA